MDEAKLREEKVNSENIFDGFILHVRKDTVRLPNGKLSTREYIIHGGAVCVVPITEDGRVYMERQFRYPLDSVISEIPAGKLDGPDEDRLDAAKRELLEETGLTADRWTSMGDYHPSAAYTSERLTMYLAEGLHRHEQRLDEGEFLNVELIPLDELVDAVMRGEITDGKTQAALLKAHYLLQARK